MARVMIVDDEKDVLYLLKFLMEKENFEVIEATNGLEAYNKLTSDIDPARPDVIVLDIMMPEMDGYTFQAKLQETEQFRNVPIIILTARGQMKDLFELSTNIHAFVEKPFDPKNLIRIVREALNKNGN